MEFSDKTVLVTGSSQGIGREIALKFSQLGAFTLVTYCRNKEKGEAVIEEIKSKGGKAALVKLDMQSSQSVESTIRNMISEYKRVDILINNAGISGYVGPIVETPLEEWKKLMDVNLNSMFLTTKLILPEMIKNKYGRIVNISSVAYRKNTANTASYNVSKAGLNAFTKTLSKEVGASGITVNVVAPGLVLTDRIKNDRLPNLAKKQGKSIEDIEKVLLADTDTKCFSTVADVADATLFLASNMAKNITGEIINVSGGF